MTTVVRRIFSQTFHKDTVENKNSSNHKFNTRDVLLDFIKLDDKIYWFIEQEIPITIETKFLEASQEFQVDFFAAFTLSQHYDWQHRTVVDKFQNVYNNAA
jgi:hypothetical protein